MIRAMIAQRLTGPALAAVAAVCSAWAARSAQAAPYVITPVVQSIPNGVQVSGAADHRDDGSVVFGGATTLPGNPGEPPTFQEGIYLFRNGVVTPVYQAAPGASVLRITSNDRGDIAFYSQINNDQTIYRIPAPGGTPTIVAADPPRGGYDVLRLFPDVLLLGQDGRTLFPAQLPDQSFGTFDGPDPVANLVAPLNTPIGGTNLQFVRPDGTVLFRGVSTSGKGIYAGTDPGALVLDVSRYLSPGGYVENVRGDVAFTGFVPVDGGQGISGVFTGPDPVADRLADNTGLYSEFDSLPEIAADGTVVFSSLLDDGRRGIFTGPDPIADKIIATGDSLFGSTVTFARTNVGETTRGGVNQAGQVLFTYTLADGRRGLALASPVPEPAGSALLALCAAACLRRRRR